MFDIRVVEGSPPAAETGAEETTFESLYRTHARRIYSLAYRFTGNAADAEELLQDIFLRALPDGYRAAFVLHEVEGYEHREVAALLGIAVGTSKSQVHKARLRLRAILRRP